MKIISLKDRPEHLMTLAKWHHAEWSYLNPERSFEARVEEMQCDLRGDVIPTTFVAERDGELLGSASMLAEDMSTHPELTPWLASVFVAPAHRKQGIGSVLVKRIMDHACDNGVKKLYLYTPDQEQLYAGLGWQILSREPYNGTPVTIMSVEFN
ncbi:MAG: GNAT family N-acetyltransferase [Gammaproteobacteria bacterium]|nr:GNAT family N-acetyltransferase [Gammaproteobacteria bacterium]MBJ55880.1 GNAT family N-acetyltransferase [Gammaproteobacteria bacterium]MBJ56457.1 GNAT family N-acetyltransferase [Gammaproteobacteria bacterium]HBN13632.1 GNAT family N-acetyltransferase [Pseudohongiella sp.]|tara:strand:- start:876 stop:1337 length:462 start_codon:yes stop_codon:yes gene_type:complete